HLLEYLEQPTLAREYRRDVSWFDAPNQPVVNTPLKVWQCPSAQPGRVVNGSLPTVTPPPANPFTGTAACGAYAGMSILDAGLVSAGVIDPPGGPRDERGHYEGAFEVNVTRCLADFVDGSTYTILIAECAGRPQLWRGRTQVPNLWLSGAGWASRNLLFGRGTT